MKFKAEIDIMPLKELLDPQGKAVTNSMNNIGIPEIDNIRVGKHISLEINAANESEASEKVTLACEKLLANPVMEYFDFRLSLSH
jgi:phosphoribosylformylglycinamidine synthase